MSEKILKKINKLPPPLQQQIWDYIEYLEHKYASNPADVAQKKKFNYKWEGGLKEAYPNMTSVELQHLANKLR